jgi:uncharacterized membrane protein HdeD (DUF308 family)
VRITLPGRGGITRHSATMRAPGTKGAVMASYPVDDIAEQARTTVRDISAYWWLWLVTGTIWVVVSLVVLQFDKASVTTVGIIVGLMFLFSAAQQFIAAGFTEGGWRWVLIGFGVLLAVAGVIALVRPKNTFAGLADILGFLFLLVGVTWVVQAFVEREASSLWWLGLVSGILMVILAFWTSGQFFIDKVYLLLVFAGVWALMHGVTDIVRAFEVRSLHKALD